ncbi:MAG: aminotransferase class V-fold PLP-dependent enzyme [Planctomycetota bacterium]|jgi:L-seryl-tRNA(Ser) seleniumtransferase|nr:aminotransferase class V-fold PLP-dependent enzyme [Planctomycetota bacterium]
MPEIRDPRPAEGLRPVINVSGTMTSLGASMVVPEAIRAVREFLPHFVEMADLQRKASAVIAGATGGEAGVVTASASAGVSQTVAALMVGTDLAAAERLPDVSGLPRDEVIMQLGHLVNYGAPIDQSVRLTGARLRLCGTATETGEYQLAGSLTDRTAAGLYVVSHHVVNYGQLSLPAFARVCHSRGVPVIVDAASEYDLRGFLAAGADVAIYSGHKFLGGPTAGIVAGPREIIRAVYLQSHALGRGMKVGKEGVIGVMAALRAWKNRDHADVRARENGYLELWRGRLSGLPGLTPVICPDPTGNPLSRLRVRVDPDRAGITAWDLADRLAGGDPPVIVRDHEVELGYFFLDPCNLHPGEERLVADRIGEECARAASEPVRSCLDERNRRRTEAMLRWPD